LEETNSFFNGGVKGASDTFTAALWALDYMYWWASHGADGINFHTGDTVAAGQDVTPCRYAAYWSTPTGYDAHPVGYAVAAFNLGGHGALLPTAQSGETLNLRTYATAASDGSLYVTIINMEHGSTGRDAAMTLAVPTDFAHASTATLSVPGNDIAATSGETLGGAAIANDGTWNGGFADLPTSPEAGHCIVQVPAGSAVVVRLTK
jgi:hypothetical protein